jgi:hypothetical protein
MQNSLLLERLLQQARREFDTFGRIGLITAVQLQAIGCIPHQIEDQWSRK